MIAKSCVFLMKTMKSFSIEKVLRTSSNGESRLGTLQLCLCPSSQLIHSGNKQDDGVSNAGGISLRTPMYLIHTQSGSIPHVTPEVFQLIHPSSNQIPPLQISIDSTTKCAEALKNFENGGMGRYVGFPDVPTFLTTHDPLQPLKSGHNDKFGIALWSRHGRSSLTPEDFSKAVGSYKPSLCQILSDYDVRPEISGLKRLKKSLNRAEEYTKVVLKENEKSVEGGAVKSTGLFITVEAAWFEMDEKLAKNTVLNLLESQHQIEGVVISGLIPRFPNTLLKKNDEGKRVEPKKLDVCESLNMELLDKIIKVLPPGLPKYTPGPFRLPQMVDLISKGVDILDGSITTIMADNAEVFLLDKLETVLHSITMSVVKSKSVKINEELSHRDGKDTDVSDDASSSLKSCVISLKEKQFFEELSPLSNCCACYTCRKHTRSYVHHLYATDELLGPVLLQIHNMTAVDRFFEIMRGLLQDSDSAEDVEKKLATVKELLA